MYYKLKQENWPLNTVQQATYVYTHCMFQQSHSVVGVPSDLYFSSQLIRFNPFQANFGIWSDS